jgi:para-nitrobenzyl esterase
MIVETPLGPVRGYEHSNCLFLNVYTPAADEARRPVLFWIHGGGHIMGSGCIYDGDAFIREHDVVVVSINYRMGAMGFMHVGHLDPSLGSSVNNGILDQICALEWVRDNIAAFGGDPGNVLVFGESAGGTSTAMLLGCPRADGLFHKAVVHSPHVDLIEVGQGHIDFTSSCIRRLGGDPEKNGLETLQTAPVEALTQLALPDFSDPHGTVPFLGGGCRHEGTLFPMTLGFDEFDEAEAVALFEQ